MKRYGNLWLQIIAWENLILAAHRAQKGKRFRENVLEFNYNLEQNLFQLQAELRDRTYYPGTYKTFQIYDPKPRLISAAPYRDRVVHHALCNIIQPLIERSFIQDTYANRIGYGSHRALRRKGLPIGNLTSQILANFYLDSFDHFVKEKLKVKKYLRYVDDFALFSNDPDFLAKARREIEENIADLRLKIHPIKSQLFETQYGANFVGFRVFSDRIRIRNDNLRRARLRLKQMQEDYSQGSLSLEKLKQRMQSWEAHLSHGDTYKLRSSIFDSYSFSRSNL